jgi:hypothetical protein
MADLTLSVLTALPERFLTVSAGELANVLAGPTLIHLPGRRSPPVLVCILLHGNETVGLHAMQAVLHKYAGAELPRALSIYVGNVRAAAAGVRRLDDQPDYNRVWPGGATSDTLEAAVARTVIAEMRARGAFASLDLHNNTGLNPLYACVSSRDPHNLHLAALFSRTVVYFEQPAGTQVGAFAALCPAVAVECGKPGNADGEARAAQLVEAVLHLAEFPAAPVHAHDIDLFHTIGMVRVRADVEFAFSPAQAALVFDYRIDHYNFRELPSGTRFGRVTDALQALPLEVRDAAGRLVSERFFALREGVLSTAAPLMPAMLTTDPNAIRQDCLCYLMERAPTA